MTDDPHDLAVQRVANAMQRLQEEWSSRTRDFRAVCRNLDELDVAVELWLDVQEPADRQSEKTG